MIVNGKRTNAYGICDSFPPFSKLRATIPNALWWSETASSFRKSEFESTWLLDSDTLEIVHFVGGG